MKRFMTVLALAVLVAAPAAFAQEQFGWTISNSTADPLSNTGAIAPDPANPFGGLLFLWLMCDNFPDGSGGGGMSAAEFDIVELTGTSGATPSAFGTQNGFLNAGGVTDLLLAVGACPMGAVLAGQFSLGPDNFVPDVELCIVNSAANNRNLTVDCLTGLGVTNATIGFRKTAAPSCIDQLCPVPVHSRSWGEIKGLYR